MLKEFGLAFRNDSFIGDKTPTWKTIKTFDSYNSALNPNEK